MRNPLSRFLRASKDTADTLFISDGAVLDLKAAAGEGDEPKRFDAVAYGGGIIRAAGLGGPVVVDLAGVTFRDDSIPILRDHNDTRVVGHAENVQIDPSKGITAQGIISGGGEDATEVLTASKSGFPWKMSMGSRILKRQNIPRGSTVNVNGRTFHGPIGVIRESEVYELSVVALAAETETSVQIAATLLQKDTDMKFHEWLKDKGFDPENLVERQELYLQARFDDETALLAMKPGDTPPPIPEALSGFVSKSTETIKAALDKAANKDGEEGEEEADPTADLRAKHAAEITRIGKLDTICEGHPDLHAKGVSEGWDSSKAELEVMKAQMDKGPNIQVHGGNQPTGSVLEAALCTAGGLEDVEKQYDDKTLQAAHDAFGGRVGLKDLLLQAAHDNGYSCRGYGGNEKDILRAAFSTTSLPGIFSNTANKFLLQGFNHVESSWRSISAIGTVSDFKERTSYRMLGDMTYEQLAPTGEIKHAQVDEQSFTNKAVTYARMFGITRVDIINDDLGALSAVPTKIGMGAAHKINNVFWTEFMDNSTFFTGARNNRETGAGSALGIAGLSAAELAFLDQVDPDGLPLGLDPKILMVPNALFVTATQLMHDLEVRDESSGTGTKKFLTGNPHAGKWQVEKSSFLGNASFTGNSVTAWYLLADPGTLATIEMVFLNGKQVPTTDTAEADFNQLGIQMRGYIDFGVNKQEFLAGVANDGA